MLCILVLFGANAQTTINKLKRARNDLQKSEDEHRAFMENLTAGIFRFTINPTGRIVRANPAIAGIFGYRSVEEFMRTKIIELFPNSAGKKDSISEIKSKGSVSGRELVMRKRSGRGFWVSCSAAVISDESGKIRWIDGVIEDINELKRAEHEKRLLEYQLNRVQKMEAVGTLASGIANDFNNLRHRQKSQRFYNGAKCRGQGVELQRVVTEISGACRILTELMWSIDNYCQHKLDLLTRKSPIPWQDVLSGAAGGLFD